MNLITAALSRHHRKIWILVVLLALVCHTMAAEAIVIESFGPADTYHTVNGLLIGDITPNGTSDISEWAVRFDVPGSALVKINTIQIAASYIHGIPNQLDIQIRTDANAIPGEIVDSVSFTNITDQRSGQVLVGNSDQMAILSPASRYWISASAPGAVDEALMAWFAQPAIAVPRVSTNRINGGPWQGPFESEIAGVFRITGIAIPEPSTSILLVVTSLNTLHLRRRIEGRSQI